MKITTIGIGTIGGTLARLRTSAGHEVTEPGRDGGDPEHGGFDEMSLPARIRPAINAVAGGAGLTRNSRPWPWRCAASSSG